MSLSRLIKSSFLLKIEKEEFSGRSLKTLSVNFVFGNRCCYLFNGVSLALLSSPWRRTTTHA